MWGRRVLWLVAIWTASVLALGVAALADAGADEHGGPDRLKPPPAAAHRLGRRRTRRPRQRGGA